MEWIKSKNCEGLWTQQWDDDDDAILMLIKWLCHWAELGSLRIISDQCLLRHAIVDKS